MQSVKGLKLHEVERHLLSSLLQLGLHLLGYYIHLIASLVSQRDIARDNQGKKMRNKGIRVRPYLSVFGKLGVERVKYYSATEKTCYPLDAALRLPKGKYSYLLEDWMAFGAVEAAAAL